MENEKTIRYFSMFTGVGGFELGFERANDLSERERIQQGGNEINLSNNKSKLFPAKQFTCVGMSEINKYSNQVLKYKFPTIKNWGDCTKINPSELPDFDMFCGGFPCQAFSIAGKRRGFQDTRGTMFFEIVRILKVKRPKIILLENVKGLLNHAKGETFRIILQTLSELEYDIQTMVLNSKFFGVPQNRERVFIIGNLRGSRRSEILPFNQNEQEIIKEGAVTRTFTAGGHSGGLHSNSTGIIIKGYLNEDGWDKRNECIRRIYDTSGCGPIIPTGQGGGVMPKIRAVLTPDRPNKRQHGRRFKEPGEPSFTLTGQDIHGICKTVRSGGKGSLSKKHEWDIINTGYSIRRLTPVECCRLQGFPDDWNKYGIDEKGEKVLISDTQRYKMMGNAVTVNVIKAVAEKLNKTMENIENFDEGDTQVAKLGEFKKIGCGLIVAKIKDGEIKCGQEMFGKKRYCAYCQNLIESS